MDSTARQIQEAKQIQAMKDRAFGASIRKAIMATTGSKKCELKKWIVAKRIEDESDSQADYFSHRVRELIVLGTSTVARDSFPEFRKAARLFSHTAYLADGPASYEHRDTYAWGAGNYLKQHWINTSEWCVASKKDKYDFHQEEIEIAFSKGDFIPSVVSCLDQITLLEIFNRLKVTHPSSTFIRLYIAQLEENKIKAEDGILTDEASNHPDPALFGEVSFRLNEDKNGVELVFKTKPTNTVILFLKHSGFKWSSVRKVWYAKQSPQSIAIAKRVVTALTNGVKIQDVRE